MRILYAVSEVTPFAKTGGLADVAGALPAALAGLGHDVKVVMPGYKGVKDRPGRYTPRGNIKVSLTGVVYPFDVEAGRLPETSVEILFLSNSRLFDRPGLYQEKGKDYPDNLERFAAFSRAILEVPGLLDWHPDVIHCNDWQTALVPAYIKAHFPGDPRFTGTGSLLTIHNLGYQGLFPASEYPKLSLPPEFFTPETLEFYGKVNLLKAGLVFADILTTVSPTYSHEIQTPQFGCGLEGILRARSSDLLGIINGVDYQQWDPAHDRHLGQHYDFRQPQGKSLCRGLLQKASNLPVSNVPLIGMITRLTPQKGVDLVIEVLDELMMLDIQVVILGEGDPDIHLKLKEAMGRYPKKLSVHINFDESLAHMIEAGSDMFLIPSRYEPCGLNQLYSLRYGTVPIVRKTGGLADTVIDATPSNITAGKANGFLFEHASSHELLTTVRLALKLFREKDLWLQLIRNGMMADFSWGRSAKEYERLYCLAIDKAAEKSKPE